MYGSNKWQLWTYGNISIISIKTDLYLLWSWHSMLNLDLKSIFNYLLWPIGHCLQEYNVVSGHVRQS